MSTKPRPALVEALATIGDSDLPPIQREVLRCMLRWWNPTTGELWPSLHTIAADCGRNEATIRRAFRKLEKRGIIEVTMRTRGGIDAKGRGRTHRMRLHFDRVNPRPVRGLETENPRVECVEPAPAVPTTRASGASNPRITPAKPSNHQQTRELSIEPGGQSFAAPSVGGWVDGRKPEHSEQETLRGVLEKAGIRGPNLDLLAGTTLTCEEVKREAASIAQDQHVRNRAAVLVRRLADSAGVVLSKRPVLDSGSLKIVGAIEAKRRRMRAM